MPIVYRPGEGIEFDYQTIFWGLDRHVIRTMLNNCHEESDSLYELSEFFDGDKSRDIEVKKEISTAVIRATVSLSF